MFEFSLPEMLLILVVALLVVGPQKLPGLAREAGLWIGRIRRYAAHVQADIRREMEGTDMARDFGELHRELRAAGDQVRDLASRAGDFARTAVSEESEDSTGEVDTTSHAGEASANTAPADAPEEQPATEALPAQPTADTTVAPAPDAGGETKHPERVTPAAAKSAAEQRIVPPAG